MAKKDAMDLPNHYETALSGVLNGWNVNVCYDLRRAYSYTAWRKRERRTAEDIRSIGVLIDRLENIAVLTEDEIENLHSAYLERIPARDVRQRIDTSGGKYHWLTLTIDFGPFSEVTQYDLLKVMITISERGIVCNTTDKILWQDESKFRSYVIVFHELVHLQQDLTTGLGAWDWVHAESEKLAQIRRASGCAVADIDPIQFQMLYGGRTEAVKDQELFVCSSLKAMFGSFGQELFQDLTIEGILEAEALASVYIHLQASVFAEPDEGHVSGATDMYHPASLPPIYSSVLQHFIKMVANSPLHSDISSDVVGACVLTAFACDLSLAVPPPDMVTRSGYCHWEFDPRLLLAKVFGHIVEAIQSRPFELKSFIYSLNFRGLASVVLDDIPEGSIFGLDSSARYQAIYEGWTDFLEKRTDHLAIDVLRAELMRLRAKDPFRFSLKNQYIMDVPYISFNAGFRSLHIESLLSLRPDLKPAKAILWQRTFLDHLAFETNEIRAIERLIDHYQSKTPFRCPFAASPNCHAWAGGCFDGWSTLTDLPSGGCRIREFCQKASLPIN